MTASTDMAAILEDLAAGRIDAAEAARRIDALSVTNPRNAQSTGPVDSGTAESTVGQSESAPPTAADADTAGPDDADPVRADPTPADATPTDATPTDATRPDTTSADATPGDPEDEAELPHPDAWAASTDRPQTPGAAKESFRSDTTSSRADNQAPRGRFGRSRTPATGGVERLSVRAVGRRVRIVGEPSVATVSADGPHVLRRNGPVLEVSSDGEFGASIDGFQLLRATRSLDDFRSLGLGKELLLKVNPALLVDVEVTAGSLNTEGVPRLGSVRVTAGGARLLDVSEIADALVQAGQATVKGAITSGRSRIRVESGSLSLQLSDASNVTITTDAQLGKVSWGGAHAGFTGDEVVLGNGSARLSVEVVMGHASVRAGTVGASSGAA